MPQFFATTAKGLSEPLASELAALGCQDIEKHAAGVSFEGNWETCYKVNLHSRIASRVIKPVLDFIAYQPDELYQQILRHDFTKYISPSQTIKVEASVSDCKLHDQRFVALKTKDAIVDQFREKWQQRPDVSTDDPDLRVLISGVKNQFRVAIDTSGESLFRRGYRKSAGEAPMKENLAAGLIVLSGWDRQSPIVDPMCGSGTILIEAALMAMNIAPGSLRKRFGFERLNGFNPEIWNRLVEEAMNAELSELPFKFHGTDVDRAVIRAAKENARAAGVDHVCEFKVGSVTTLTAPCPQGMIITNPPYGTRMGELDNLRDVYRDFSHTLKIQFIGWDVWILSGNKDLIADLKLKASQKIFLYNGNLECRFLNYKIREH